MAGRWIFVRWVYKLCLRPGRKQSILNWCPSWFCPVARHVVGQYTTLGHGPFLPYPFQFIITNFSRPKSPAMIKNTHPCGEGNFYAPPTRHPNRCLWKNIIPRTDPPNPINLCSKFFLVTKLWNAWLPVIYKINVLERTCNAHTNIEWQVLSECLTKSSIYQEKYRLSSDSF
jgi:hypothetical protein